VRPVGAPAEVDILVAEGVRRIEAPEAVKKRAVDHQRSTGHGLERPLLTRHNGGGSPVMDVEGPTRARVEPHTTVLDRVVGQHQPGTTDTSTSLVEQVHHLP
jgi:hypothetical protein